MTTEIAIINRQGVALAADSAVTVGKERVWKTANKLFSLGPSHDIGIMMHGAAEYLGVPWETIIKLFRSEAQNKTCAKVEDCARDFVEFVKSDRFRNQTLEIVSLAGQYIDLLTSIKRMLKYGSKLEFRSQIVICLDAWLSVWAGETGREIFDTKLSLDEFSGQWRSGLKRLAKDVFGEVITNAICDKVVEVAFEYTRRKIPSDYLTGVVIAGFGRDQVMPSMVTYEFDGRARGIVRVWLDRRWDLNDPEAPNASVIPFGQSDVIYMLMEGISREAQRYISTFFERILAAKSASSVKNLINDSDQALVESALQGREDKKFMAEFKSEFSKFRSKSFVNPIVSVIRSLPKEEMATMAESLVDITSLRRRVDSPLESVGGPVDVAVISKGDGFIWIKRKHYFDIAANRDFLYRKHTRGDVS